MKRRWFACAAAALMLLAAGTLFCQAEAAEEGGALTLKFGHQISEKSAEGIAAQAFADLAAEKSGGSIEIVVFPGEQLGSAPVMLESVMIGTLDLAMVAGQFLGSYDATMSMVNIPYFFKDPATYREVLRSTGLGDRQVEKLRGAGFTLVNTDRNFFRGDRLIASVKPIRSIDDFKGLRFRAFENDIYVASYTKLGANVLVVPWGETYSALRQGTVESSCASIDQLYSTGFAEVCPYITWTKEYYTEVLMVANNDLWDSLSEEQQKILTEAANEAGIVMEREVAKSTRNDVERIEKEFGAQFISMDTAPLRDVLTPYYYELEQKGVIPDGVVDSILAQR
jgi:TRAP-type transport system periplasmic protein